jgi:predicted metal-dependent hydrolase
VTDLVFICQGRTVPLSVIRRAGMRRMNLRIDARAGAVKLTLPRLAPLGPAMRWVEEKRPWVEEQLAKMPQATGLAPGMTIPIGDTDYCLDWNEDHARLPKKFGQSIQIGGPIDAMPGRLLRWLKREALIRLRDETQRVATRAGVTIEGIGIGDPTTRWGSCSSSGTIRYSWRLILAPDFVLRATVAHEVAHRVHMNHGAQFHALVATLYEADPKPARLWLRAHAARLHGFGRAAP